MMHLIKILFVVVLAALAYFFYSSSDSGGPAPEIAPAFKASGEQIKQKVKERAKLEAEEARRKDALKKPLTPEAKATYANARALAISGNFKETSDVLHQAFNEEPALVDRVLLDQAFRKYREEDDFRKLLNIMGRDSFQDLGKGPIVLPEASENKNQEKGKP